MPNLGGKIILTRPQTQAEVFINKIALALTDQGFLGGNRADIDQITRETLQIFPFMKIIEVDAFPPSAENFDALIVTSVHAVREKLLGERYKRLPVYVVGELVADKIKSLGWDNNIYTAETVDGLCIKLQAEILENRALRFLYLRGKDVTCDIKSIIPHSCIQDCIVYKAEAVTAVPEGLERELKDGNIMAITFFSKRTAMIFHDIIFECGLENKIRGVKALCLSEAMLGYVKPLFGNEVYVSDAPNSHSMLNLVQDLMIKGIVNR